MDAFVVEAMPFVSTVVLAETPRPVAVASLSMFVVVPQLPTDEARALVAEARWPLLAERGHSLRLHDRLGV